MFPSMDDGKKSFLEKIMPNMKTCNGISVCFSLSCSFVTIKSVKSVISIYSGTNLFSNSERSKHLVFITFWPLVLL